MYDFQTQNGVEEILEKNAHYTFYVFPGPSYKKQIILEAYERAIIPWKPECEQGKFTKQQMLDLFSEYQKKEIPKYYKKWLIALIVFTVLSMLEVIVI